MLGDFLFMVDDKDLDPTLADFLSESSDDDTEEFSFDDFTDDIDAGSTDDFDEPRPHTSAKNPAVAKAANAEPYKVDITREQILPVERFGDETSNGYFDEPGYYKTALAGEGDISKRVHQLLSKYLTCQDQKERVGYRQSIIPSWWGMMKSACQKVADRDLPMPKKMMIRFGVVLPSLFTPEQKDLFSKSILNNETGEPVYYLDEWLKEVALGHIVPSTTDEKVVRKVVTAGSSGNEEQDRLMQLKNKNDVKLQTCESQANKVQAERAMTETELKGRVDVLCTHERVIGLESFTQAYTEGQKALFAEIFEKLRTLQRIDKELSKNLSELEEAREVGISLEQKLSMGGDMGGNSSRAVYAGNISGEFDTIRQMTKMTCGRRGNPFPVFTREFYHCTPNLTGFRERVISLLRWVEMNDRSAFRRKIKGGNFARILPFVILVPSYGDFGFCWQPFERLNRSMSRGRIVIPMYPRNLKVSLLMAVADYRWQYAKERSIDWTDPQEGITGQYYQYLEAHKIKGDIKSLFMADYVTWMTKEIEGTQIMEKELRGIFWRGIPFSREKREELSKRSMNYLDLYKKDAVRFDPEFTKMSQQEFRNHLREELPYDMLQFPGVQELVSETDYFKVRK